MRQVKASGIMTARNNADDPFDVDAIESFGNDEKMEEQRPKARGLEDDQDSEVIPEVEDELGGWGEYEEGP